MRVCFDSNVVIDIMGKSQQFFASLCAYDVVLTNNYDPVIPMFATTDIAFILQRSYLDKQKAREAIEQILVMFTLLDGHPLDCRLALDSNMTDYEDALIAFSAKRNGVDIIITRNKKDFVASPVPALTPEEFVELFKPKGIDYAELDGGAAVAAALL
jgi:predicted nucleic acid-binding protein